MFGRSLNGYAVLVLIHSGRRDRLMQEEKSLNERLLKLEEAGGDDRVAEEAKSELSTQLADVHARLAEMEAESGPARAALLLAGRYILLMYCYITRRIWYRSWICRVGSAQSHKDLQWWMEVSISEQRIAGSFKTNNCFT